MKTMKLKALAVAVVGLAAGNVMAVCPATPFAAWTSTDTGAQLGGSISGTSPGTNGSGCKMAAKYTTVGSNGSQAIVYDDSPSVADDRYRFKFIIDATNVSSALSTTNTTLIFNAASSSSHPATPPVQSQIVTMQLLKSGGVMKLRTFAACTSGDNMLSNRCRSLAGDLTLPAGEQRIEGDVVFGGTGQGVVKIWLGANVNESSPDRIINVDNSAWHNGDGVDRTTLGLHSATKDFRTAALNAEVYFDEFDSRRQTFIGQ